MSAGWVEVGTGVLAVVGLFACTVAYIFKRLDSKVEKDTFEQYAKRIDETLEDGKDRFKETAEAQKEMLSKLNDVCMDLKWMKTVLGFLGKKSGLEFRREGDPPL